MLLCFVSTVCFSCLFISCHKRTLFRLPIVTPLSPRKDADVSSVCLRYLRLVYSFCFSLFSSLSLKLFHLHTMLFWFLAVCQASPLLPFRSPHSSLSDGHISLTGVIEGHSIPFLPTTFFLPNYLPFYSPLLPFCSPRPSLSDGHISRTGVIEGHYIPFLPNSFLLPHYLPFYSPDLPLFSLSPLFPMVSFMYRCVLEAFLFLFFVSPSYLLTHHLPTFSSSPCLPFLLPFRRSYFT